jgi:hypothetical protein
MIKLPIPHSFEPTESLKHDHTPKKATVLDTIRYLENHHIDRRKRDIFQYFNVPERTGFCWATKNEPRRLHNCSDSDSDSCGRKRKLTRDNLRKMKDFLSDGFQCRVLN